MMDERVIETAMAIILSAGDARVSCNKALDAISDGDFEIAEEMLKDANVKIREAHKNQTNAIQGETSGEKSEYSVLFAHAQDTLMTIYTEINITKKLLKIFKAYEKRISMLEK